MKPSERTPRARGRAGIATVAVGLSCLALAAPAAAISGNAGGADASAAQYLAPSGNQVPASGNPVPASAPSKQPSEGQVTPLGEETPVNEAAPSEAAVLPATPVASEEAGLPFTGYVLFGIVLAGLIALLIGLLMRRFTTWRLS